MDLNTILTIALSILSILLIAIVLLQQSEAGLYGQGANINRTRRGSEKTMFNFTIIIGTLFILAGILKLLIA